MRLKNFEFFQRNTQPKTRVIRYWNHKYCEKTFRFHTSHGKMKHNEFIFSTRHVPNSIWEQHVGLTYLCAIRQNKLNQIFSSPKRLRTIKICHLSMMRNQNICHLLPRIHYPFSRTADPIVFSFCYT